MSDYSCYITIVNDSGDNLEITTPPPEDGTWNNPPATVDANTTSAQFALNYPSGPVGSEGGFVAAVQGTAAMLQASFEDPWGSSDNSCNISAEGLTQTMSWTYTGASGSPDNPEPNAVPGGGHPVYLVFTFADSSNPEAKTAPAQIPA